MPRKTVSFLNQLRQDVYNTQHQIDEAGVDLEQAGSEVASFPVHDLVTNDYEFKQAFNQLVFAHTEMAKLIKSFRIARDKYLEFF
jgi:hypothetical protein